MTVCEFARQVDEDGEKAFRRLAGATENPGVRRIFTAIAGDENILAGKISELPSCNMPAGAPEPAMLESLRSEVAEMLDTLGTASANTDVEAYQLAADYEERICRLYRLAADQAGDTPDGTLLQQVGSWECKEAEELRKAHDFVNAPNEFLAWGEFSNVGEFHNFGRDVD